MWNIEINETLLAKGLNVHSLGQVSGSTSECTLFCVSQGGMPSGNFWVRYQYARETHYFRPNFLSHFLGSCSLLSSNRFLTQCQISVRWTGW